ncbi:hypothetical protein B0H13DRAFT_1898081 [Mycena leptocephala]|nr:hypothetical protein B0H13DRAFT_1898081 [Mycena leptocephala]
MDRNSRMRKKREGEEYYSSLLKKAEVQAQGREWGNIVAPESASTVGTVLQHPHYQRRNGPPPPRVAHIIKDRREKFTRVCPGDIGYNSPSNAPPVGSPRMHSTPAPHQPSGLHYTRLVYASAHPYQTRMYPGKPGHPTASIPSHAVPRTHRAGLPQLPPPHNASPHPSSLERIAYGSGAPRTSTTLTLCSHSHVSNPRARQGRGVSGTPTIVHLSPRAYTARQTNVHHRTDTTKPADTSRACTAPQNQGKATDTSPALAPDLSPRILMLPACTSSTTQRKHVVGA